MAGVNEKVEYFYTMLNNFVPVSWVKVTEGDNLYCVAINARDAAVA
jgi:hypothetical protein